MDDILAYAILLIILLIFIKIDQSKIFKTNKEIGDLGEDIISKKLIDLGSDYVILNNLKIFNIQIDHLVINHSLKICFVIETKFWGGKITGKLDDSYWQQDNKGKIKYYQNPIKQNEYHCLKLRKKYDGYQMYNIVVFVKNKQIPHYKCIVDENNILNYIKHKTNHSKKNSYPE